MRTAVKGILIACVLSILSLTAPAQTTKVVVIPMAGESIMPKPFAPLTKQSPPDDNYIISTDTVIDKTTGLEWQRIDDDTIRNYDDAYSYCIGLAPISESPWRLPLLAELLSIVDYEGLELDPAINTVAFPLTKNSYWSRSRFAATSSGRWAVSFHSGLAARPNKGSVYYTRCVRFGNPVGALLRDNGNDTVTDFATGLTWQRSDAHNTTGKTQSQAITYCSGLSLAGGGWRLPEVKELSSIVDLLTVSPAIDSNYFPGAKFSGYWSGTSYAKNNVAAFRILFDSGDFVITSKTSPQYVRCVR